jgi:hypothetical protein
MKDFAEAGADPANLQDENSSFLPDSGHAVSNDQERPCREDIVGVTYRPSARFRHLSRSRATERQLGLTGRLDVQLNHTTAWNGALEGEAADVFRGAGGRKARDPADTGVLTLENGSGANVSPQQGSLLSAKR